VLCLMCNKVYHITISVDRPYYEILSELHCCKIINSSCELLRLSGDFSVLTSFHSRVTANYGIALYFITTIKLLRINQFFSKALYICAAK